MRLKSKKALDSKINRCKVNSLEGKRNKVEATIIGLKKCKGRPVKQRKKRTQIPISIFYVLIIVLKSCSLLQASWEGEEWIRERDLQSFPVHLVFSSPVPQSTSFTTHTFSSPSKSISFSVQLFPSPPLYQPHFSQSTSPNYSVPLMNIEQVATFDIFITNLIFILLVTRRLSARPTAQELRERNILKSKY